MANPGNKNCTPDIMKQMLNGSLAVSPKGTFLLENDSAVTTSGLVRNTSYIASFQL